MMVTAEIVATTEYLAALDIGSNSFHYVLARVVNDSTQVLHAEKYRVKLADGLDSKGYLSAQAIARGVETLASLVATTQEITPNNIKVVATYTLRTAKNAQAFLDAAAKVFPFEIEIISGHEEARLIYQGVADNMEPNGRRLIMDIGGGSTECIIGENFNIHTLASLPVGCVNVQQQFFADGNITERQFKQAIKAASVEITSIVKRFSKRGWDIAIGTSGTIKTIYNIINNDRDINQPITLSDLLSLKEQFIAFGQSRAIVMAGLKVNRQDVICSGLSVLIALMKMLAIKQLDYSPYALREGLLCELASYARLGDVRQRSVASLATRFSVDQEQVASVSALAENLFDASRQAWQLNDDIYKKLLLWACQLHELGVDINPSGYHKHGQYIIEHADLAGFSQEQQSALAWLIGAQRKKLNQATELNLHTLKAGRLLKLAVLLRLAILLTQQRHSNDNSDITLTVDKKQLSLAIAKQWLQERPLIDNDLITEQQILAKHQLSLDINTR